MPAGKEGEEDQQHLQQQPQQSQSQPLHHHQVDVFPHQVGGHHIIVRHPTRSECIVKSYFGKEVAFYERAQADPHLPSVISSYFGPITLSPHGRCIVLEDLTYGMIEPCILDMKIGRRLYDEDASPAKRDRMIFKSDSSTSGQVGFRISGMRSVDPQDGRPLVRLKNDVRSLKVSQMVAMMRAFFARLAPVVTRSLLLRYLTRLHQIRHAVTHSNGRFYSSSILFLYDHWDPARWDCRMIDFVHSRIYDFRDEAVLDTNYLEGLENLIEYLRRLTAEYQD